MAPGCNSIVILLMIQQGFAIPLINPNSRTLIKKKGEKIYLSCTDQSEVRWQTPSGARKSIDKHIVKIKSADPKQTGNYTCQNLNTSETSSLYVFVEDSSKLFLPLKTTQKIIDRKEGANAVIPCRVTTPNIKNLMLQQRDGKRLPPNLTYTADIYTGIQITNLKRYYEGYYVCTAMKDGELKRSEQFKLNVIPVPKRPPEITVDKDLVLLKDGEKFEINCEVKNVNHVVNVHWTYPPSTVTKVSRSSHHLQDYYRQVQTLSINSVKVNDTGNFTCVAENEFNSSYAAVFLMVVAKGFVKLLKPDNKPLDVIIGKNLVLKVEFEAYPMPNQQSWRRMDGMLFSTSAHQIKMINHSHRYVNELSLVRVKESEGGTYNFSVSNSDASSSVSFDVRINSSPGKIILQKTNESTIRCEAAGFPAPEIKLYQCPGVQQRCPHTGNEISISNKIIDQPRFGRVVVESIINITTLKSNVTVECFSYNKIGQHFLVTHYLKEKAEIQTHELFTPLLILFATTAIFLCFILAILLYKYHQKPRYQIQWKVVEEIHGNNYTYIDPTQLPYDDKWEFPRDKLRFGKILGAGAFGKVVEAAAYGLTKADSVMTVAVKMLKPSAHSTEKEALMSELKVLSHLGQHINIVNLMGACTVGGPVLVITEYCCFGDLLNFMRRKRDSFIWSENGEQDLGKMQYKNIPDLRDPESCGSYMEMKPSPGAFLQMNSDKRRSMSKSSYSDKENNNEVVDALALDIEDLLSFSYQVAKGMNFLSSKNCIHRDLAARNILLTHGRVAKICDFGLARDIRNDSNYVVKGNARLPVKWMAPESIFDCVYTFESDVWSYGILLWEIFSLGSSPYPGIPVDNNFYKMIKDGYRMQNPEFAFAELYEVMKACWDATPLRRPTFEQVVEMIEEQLSYNSKHIYSNLELTFTSKLEFSSRSSRLNSAGSSTASNQPLLMNDDVFFENGNKRVRF